MKLIVNKHSIELQKEELVNEGEYNVQKCLFEFSQEYSTLTKYATFTNCNGSYKVVVVNNQCDIPIEILRDRETFTLGVYGYYAEDDELKLRLSPAPVYVTMERGSYVEDAMNTEKPTPTDLEQLQTQVTNNRNDIDTLKEKCINYDSEIEEIQQDIVEINGRIDTVVSETDAKIENIMALRGDIPENMLNKDGQRELAYVVRIDAIEPIVGSDNCEAAVVGGWRVMVRKNTFKAGDLAIYFEIDSKVPEIETFAFLEKKHYKIKTQKYTFGGKNPGFYSQGLLMAAEDFGWKISNTPAGDYISRGDEPGSGLEEGDFLTQELGVVYSVEEDNKRKAKSVDKYKKMTQRHPKLFCNPIIKLIYKSSFGKKLLFLFFGKKTDKKGEWPLWVVKTDEERIQNLTHMIPDFCKELWMSTEKIDGSSTTFTLKGRGRKQEYAVCSRNVRMTEKSDGGWYETNIYVEMAEKYNMKYFETSSKENINVENNKLSEKENIPKDGAVLICPNHIYQSLYLNCQSHPAQAQHILRYQVKLYP